MVLPEPVEVTKDKWVLLREIVRSTHPDMTDICIDVLTTRTRSAILQAVGEPTKRKFPGKADA